MISEQPQRLEITAQVQERAKKSIILPPISNLRVGTDVFGSARVFGEFSNPYTRTMSSFARITVVVFDGTGTVIGGGFTFPDASVPPGGRIGFDTGVGGLTAGQIASVQASVEPEVE